MIGEPENLTCSITTTTNCDGGTQRSLSRERSVTCDNLVWVAKLELASTTRREKTRLSTIVQKRNTYIRTSTRVSGIKRNTWYAYTRTPEDNNSSSFSFFRIVG